MIAARLGLTYFAAVFAVGFVLGTARTLLLAPRIGAIPAVALELPVMLGAAWVICGWLLRGRHLALTECAAMGGIALLCLMLAEAGLARALGQPLSEHLCSYAEPAHLLGLLGQIGFALIPMLRGGDGRGRV